MLPHELEGGTERRCDLDEAMAGVEGSVPGDVAEGGEGEAVVAAVARPSNRCLEQCGARAPAHRRGMHRQLREIRLACDDVDPGEPDRRVSRDQHDICSAELLE